jgi:aspartyl-tRNA(Asn)/glutamyl-tRNA(Gln) amidotransferase subunit C
VIQRGDVENAARLARIRLGEDEVSQLASDLERIVGYVEQLMALDVEGVEPMVQPTSLPCPRRADEAGEVVGRKALLGSHGYDDGLVRVPRVID